jgi:hypothetical protein
MDFPGSSVSLDVSEFAKPCFQNAFASFLCRAALENIPCFAEKAHKAGVEVVETRGTPDPSLVTTMFMTMIRQFGESVTAECPLIRKRIHDDRIWSERATSPWRRSPAYLIVSWKSSVWGNKTNML